MQRKMFALFLILFFVFLISINKVSAYSDYNIIYFNTIQSLDDAENCEGILGDVGDSNSVAYFLNQIFKAIGYIGPVLCIVLSVVDFAKAAASQDKDALQKAGRTAGKRIVLAALLFFLPSLINFLFPLFGWTGTCGISG